MHRVYINILIEKFAKIAVNAKKHQLKEKTMLFLLVFLEK